MLRHFDPAAFGGIVLDESSILKNMFGKVRREIIDFAAPIPFRLAATATPAPNDLIEVLNHAAYLGRVSVKEALAMWFVQDQQVQDWRLKGHAEADFWQWVGSWAIAARKPDDIGHRMDGYDLPPLDMTDHVIAAPEDSVHNGELFPTVSGLADQRRIRRASMADRVGKCAATVNASREPWIVWCDLNDESEALAKAIPTLRKFAAPIRSKARSLRWRGFYLARTASWSRSRVSPGTASTGSTARTCPLSASDIRTKHSIRPCVGAGGMGNGAPSKCTATTPMQRR